MTTTPFLSERARYAAGALRDYCFFTGIHGHPARYRAALYGHGFDGEGHFDWTLANLAKPGTEHGAELLRRIDRISDDLCVTEWYAPRPVEFNGVIVTPDELQESIVLPSGRRIRRGALADGVFWETFPHGSRTGFMLSVGGCALVTAQSQSGTDGFGVAHAGLKSLVRWTPEERANHTSVITELAARFRDPHDVVFQPLFAIRPEDYGHSLTDPRFANESRRIIDQLNADGYGACVRGGLEGRIDLVTLMGLQAERLGASFEWPDEYLLDPYLPHDAYHTRREGPLRTHRNLLVVTIEPA